MLGRRERGWRERGWRERGWRERGGASARLERFGAPPCARRPQGTHGSRSFDAGGGCGNPWPFGALENGAHGLGLRRRCNVGAGDVIHVILRRPDVVHCETIVNLKNEI